MTARPSEKHASEEKPTTHEEDIELPLPPADGPAIDILAITGTQDGGWKAWLQVAGSFTLFFNTWYVMSD